MKRIQRLIVLLCLFISVSAKSQFSQGDKLVGGAVNIYSGNSSYTFYPNPPVNNTSFNTGLSPRYSWVTGKNVMNGVIINGAYSHLKNENPDPTQYTTTYNSYSFGAGYFLRNFKDFSQQFGWFIEYSVLANYNLYKQKNIYLQTTSESKATGFTGAVSIVPGFYYKLSTKAVIEAGFGGVGANYSKSTSGTGKSNAFNIGFNFPSNFTFGVQFLLNKKSNS